MKRGSVKVLDLALWAALLGAATTPVHASAQSQLDVAEAQAFLGEWVVDMQTDFGPFTMNLDVTDQAGKVAASMGSPEMGGPQPVTDITKSEESLLLRFSTDAQGQMIDVEVALVPNGESLEVYFDVGQGQFSATGTAPR
ncbi:MAG TPA: hypothetical protein VMM35_12835, partial [Longimicrobiales bacterium]|nr:hypothetical protein [Longimicrobiales bacterium]